MEADALTFRLALQQGYSLPLFDAFTTEPIVIPAGSALNLHCALFDGNPKTAGNLLAISDVESVKCVFRKDDAEGDLLATKTVAEFDDELTFSEWRARTSQHFTIPLTAEETGWEAELGSEWAGKVYIALEVVTSTGPWLTRSGTGSVRKSGTSTAAESGVTADEYYNRAQADARYFRRVEPESFEYGTDGSFALWNDTQERFHKLSITGTDGNEQIVIGAPGENPFRFSPTTGLPQLWNSTQAKYHSIQITGALGAEQITISAGEAL